MKKRSSRRCGWGYGRSDRGLLRDGGMAVGVEGDDEGGGGGGGDQGSGR